MKLLAVTGLAKEARIAKRAGAMAVVSACDRALLERRLAEIGEVDAVISFGIAGSLSPLLAPGDVVIPTHVVSGRDHYLCDPVWVQMMRERLPQARGAILAGVDTVVAHIAMKRALMRESGAHAVDMESHIAAAFAKARGVPFAALRTISDGNTRTLPPAALEPLKPNGKPKMRSIIRSLFSDPGQLPELIQTGNEAGRAFKSLNRYRKALGQGLCCPPPKG